MEQIRIERNLDIHKIQEEKNVKLKRERGIGFEDVIVKIYGGEVLDIIDNPNKEKYPDQRVFIIDINEYV